MVCANLKLTSDGTILLSFIASQMVLIIRIGLKFINLISANYLMEKVDTNPQAVAAA